jgi:glutaminase
LRLSYNATQVVSRRRLTHAALQVVRRYGERIRVLELQGPLVFSTFEPVVRALTRQAAYCSHVILNFRHVVSADSVSLRLLAEVREQLDGAGVTLLGCNAAKLSKALAATGIPASSLFESEDLALEACEDALLAEILREPWQEPQPVPLQRCPLLQSCDDDDLAALYVQMPSHTYNAGEVIVTSGSAADELFILVAGTVEVCLPEEGTRLRQRLDVLTAGMSFGEMAFIDGAKRSADVVTLEASECRVLSRALFESLDIQRPGLKIKILTQIARQLSSRLRQANTEIAALRS